MVEEEKVVDEVSGWLRVYDDGSVDRTWTARTSGFESTFRKNVKIPHRKPCCRSYFTFTVVAFTGNLTYG
ncbi:hypothetical protein V6N13_033032 [Hibiscus sabdariffa]|uniref:Uncharacterized protein n=1 Tax=Hibiscus sabdariffa TaxID=183260 RepID=A0ABR2FBV4_9ROSI